MSQLSTRHKLQAPQPSCFNKPIRWLFGIVKKCRSFTFFKHKHNHAIRVRSLKAPQGVLRVIPWKTWSWSGGDFQRKSIEVTSENFESITKHWDLNKSKKVLRILPSKSKLIFIEHQDIECLQVCKKKICANSGARLVESPFESYHLALLVLSTDLHRAPRGLKCSSAIKESAKSGRKGADSDVNLCSYINGNDLLLAPCPNWYRV